MRAQLHRREPLSPSHEGIEERLNCGAEALRDKHLVVWRHEVEGQANPWCDGDERELAAEHLRVATEPVRRSDSAEIHEGRCREIEDQPPVCIVQRA
jgi:hypothetical protein